MVKLETALQAVLDHSAPMPATNMPLENAVGCYLAQALIASTDLPRFDCSAVDGYGIRVADTLAASEKKPLQLAVAGAAFAGHQQSSSLESGSALKLMTGAEVPSDVEAVLMREHVIEQEAGILIKGPARSGEGIRRRGGDCRSGDLLAGPGSQLNPPLIALHAAQGLATACVHQIPKVGLLSTGDELVTPGCPIKGGQIYDSNTAGLQAALSLAGLRADSTLSCSDELGQIKESLSLLMARTQVLICTGGVSAGDKDLVALACAQLGMEIVFHGVLVKPGKPTLFALFTKPDQFRGLCFGLPGNPVAALLAFETLIRPSLLSLMGAQQAHKLRVRASLTAPLRNDTGRLELVRGRAYPDGTGLVVDPILARDSHMLKGLVNANCLIRLPSVGKEFSAGELVEIEWLSWSNNA